MVQYLNSLDRVGDLRPELVHNQVELLECELRQLRLQLLLLREKFTIILFFSFSSFMFKQIQLNEIPDFEMKYLILILQES